VNDLFEGEVMERDAVTCVDSVLKTKMLTTKMLKTKMLESETLWAQAAANPRSRRDRNAASFRGGLGQD
jgi:hypothetical protein